MAITRVNMVMYICLLWMGKMTHSSAVELDCPPGIIPCHNYSKIQRWKQKISHPGLSCRFEYLQKKMSLTCALPGNEAWTIPGRSLLWIAVAETIWAEDMEEMLCNALSLAFWSCTATGDMHVDGRGLQKHCTQENGPPHNNGGTGCAQDAYIICNNVISDAYLS